MGVQVSNFSALAYYPSQRLVTHNMHQSCVRTDLSTERHFDESARAKLIAPQTDSKKRQQKA
jgi:hypothetical protein